jgi:hypothetical protein
MVYQMANVLRGLGPPDQMSDVDQANLGTAQKQMADNLARSQLQAQVGMHNQDISLGQQSLANQANISGDYAQRAADAITQQKLQGSQQLGAIAASGAQTQANTALEMAPANAAMNRANTQFNLVDKPLLDFKGNIISNVLGTPGSAQGGMPASQPGAAAPAGSNPADYGASPAGLPATGSPAGGGAPAGAGATPSAAGGGMAGLFKDPSFARAMGFAAFNMTDPQVAEHQMTRAALMARYQDAIGRGDYSQANAILGGMGGVDSGNVPQIAGPQGLSPQMQQLATSTSIDLQPQVADMVKTLGGTYFGQRQAGVNTILSQADAIQNRLANTQLPPQAKAQIVQSIRASLIGAVQKSGMFTANPQIHGIVEQILAKLNADPMPDDSPAIDSPAIGSQVDTDPRTLLRNMGF